VSREGSVIGEDGSSNAPEGYAQWRNKQITQILDRSANNNPTNHSTIMTNPMHAEKALAYDVAIGLCYLSPEQMAELRIEADWRFGESMDKTHPNKKYSEYFVQGSQRGEPLHEWIKIDPEAKRPEKIIDEREGGFYLNLGGLV
jgi:hypothetical protein